MITIYRKSFSFYCFFSNIVL